MNIQFEKNLIITHKSRPGWDKCDKDKLQLNLSCVWPVLIMLKINYQNIFSIF